MKFSNHYLKQIFITISAIFFVAISQTLFAQSGCKSPTGIKVLKTTSSVIEICCSNSPGVFSYIARIKSVSDTAWSYYRVNSPDTILKFEKLKGGLKYFIQMSSMCSYNLSDTSAYSKPIEVYTPFDCETPSGFYIDSIGQKCVRVKWISGLDVRMYKVYYKKTIEPKGWLILPIEPSANPSCLIEGLEPDTEYLCTVRCTCNNRLSGISELVKPYLSFKTKR